METNKQKSSPTWHNCIDSTSCKRVRAWMSPVLTLSLSSFKAYDFFLFYKPVQSLTVNRRKTIIRLYLIPWFQPSTKCWFSAFPHCPYSWISHCFVCSGARSLVLASALPPCAQRHFLKKTRKKRHRLFKSTRLTFWFSITCLLSNNHGGFLLK